MKLRLLGAVTVAASLVLTACGSSDEGEAGASVSTDAPLYDKLPQAIKDAGVIRFAGDSHPPYRIVADDGKSVTGIDRELQQALETQLGVKTEVEIVAGLPAALSGMLSNRYDAFNGPVSATPEREEQFDTVTWLVTRTSYLIPKTGTAGIKTADDLCGKRIAGVAGSIIEDQVVKLDAWCKTKGQQPPVFSGLADTNGAILAAKSDRADVAGMTETAALDAMSKEKDTFSYVTQTDEQGAGEDKLALLVPKSSKLGPVMQEAFELIFANGEYQKVIQKYGLNDVAVEAPVLNAAAAG